MENHSAALQLYARQWCENPDDCIQEVLIRIAQRTEVPENWLPWLYRVVKNQAISFRRKSNRRVKHEQGAGQQRESWFSDLKCGEFDAADVSGALQQLPDKNREVITMKIWGNLTFEQISDSVDCSVSTAHERYKSGLGELKKMLNGKTFLKNSDSDRSGRSVPAEIGNGEIGNAEMRNTKLPVAKLSVEK